MTSCLMPTVQGDSDLLFEASKSFARRLEDWSKVGYTGAVRFQEPKLGA